MTVIYPVLVTVLLPPVFVAVSVTVYVPAVTYVCDGFSSVEIFPSPNNQIHDVGEFVDRSTNWIVMGAVPVFTVDRKEATGIVETPLTTI